MKYDIQEFFFDTSFSDYGESLFKKRFLELISDCVIKTDKSKYPDSFFGFKNGKCYFEYNLKNMRFYYSYYHIYTILETEFSYNVLKINELIENTVEEHFKLGSVTAFQGSAYLILLVEEHFKLGSVTAQSHARVG